ncbi:LeuD 3-isopropylmalate dehydratase small subunit [Burkholderiaceae bacterium]
MSDMSLIYQGRCWKLGDDVSSDELISAQHVFEYDPQVLRKHLLEERLSQFASQAQSGDIVLAGKRFAHGSQHTHPFLAMKAIGVGLIAEQMLRPTFRLAIYSGIPLLEIDQNVQNMLDDGDQIRVDFNKGVISNLTQNTTTQVKPVPDFLLDIIQAGGGLGYMQATLANHIVQKNTSTTTKETSHGV